MRDMLTFILPLFLCFIMKTTYCPLSSFYVVNMYGHMLMYICINVIGKLEVSYDTFVLPYALF